MQAIAVNEARNNEGSNMAYTLVADVGPVADPPAPIAQTAGQMLYYYGEVDQEAGETAEVEYVWKLYRDSNNNAIIMDDPTSPDGYKACAGDVTPQARSPIDLTTSTGSETYLIGSQWGAGATFYIGMSDFNYLCLPDDESANTEADDYWGYDAPYHFTVTLTYHSGQAFPD